VTVASNRFPEFNRKGNDLEVGGASVSAIVAQFGTPLFLYDEATLDRQLSLLRDALPPEIEIYYSVKANPSQDILKFFLEKRCGLEVASIGEFQQALTAGSESQKILFSGPGKTDSELEIVLAAGIGEIHAESIREIVRIDMIAARLATPARVALRINPTGETEGGMMRMGGRPAPFGVDEELLDHVLDVILAATNIKFRGIHQFSGTQILDYSILVDQYKHALRLAKRVVQRLGRPLNTIDFGGGFGVPYFEHEKPLDLVSLKAELEELWSVVRRDPDCKGTRFLVEPGRFLVGEAGLYVTSIQDIKESRGKKFLIVNGGMHHHLAASGNLGQTIKHNYPVANISRLNAPAEEVVDVVGPLCTPLDVLGRGVTLPKSEVGDLIAVFQSGAYARSASPLGFLSHPSPAEVYVANGSIRLSRERGNVEDYLRDQMPSIARRI
jgi:diaminopimelate decarboxylase